MRINYGSLKQRGFMIHLAEDEKVLYISSPLSDEGGHSLMRAINEVLDGIEEHHHMSERTRGILYEDMYADVDNALIVQALVE